MSIRNLDSLFEPHAVAVIGASPRLGSIGFVVTRNLLQAGFDGPIMPVNPRHQSVCGVLAYPSIAALPVVPDLAVICTPPAVIPGLIDELGRRGTRAAVIITAGLSAIQDGRSIHQRCLDAAKPYLLRILGPNCLGIMVPKKRLNAGFAHLAPRPGQLAFVAQSGALITAVLDWAEPRGIGFSHVVSLGDTADVDFGDMLDYLAMQPGTTGVLLYVEAVTQARKFVSAARACARLKPVVVVKAGRHAQAAQAAASHTGALAGVDEVYDAVFRRAGLLRVRDTQELFDAVETLTVATPAPGDRLAILTNGGGPGVLATDYLLDAGGNLAALSPATIGRLDAVLPPTWSGGNPVDIIGDAPGDRYRDALAHVLEAPEVDAVLVLNAPTAIASGTAAAESVVSVATAGKPILTSWLGGTTALAARQIFRDHRLPTYATPEEAVRGFMHLVHHKRNQDALLEVPGQSTLEVPGNRAAARALIERALGQKRTWLSTADSLALLRHYDIPVVETAFCLGPDEAATAASQMPGPYALKIQSPDIVHKSDVGGVAINLSSPTAVRDAAEAMINRVRSRMPAATIEGLILQPMLGIKDAYEVIAGMTEDTVFGPVVLFGRGGVEVELSNDKTLELAPLNLTLARNMIARTRVARLFAGFRDRPPIDSESVGRTLVRLSELVGDLPEVKEIEINPLVAGPSQAFALDARVRVAPARLPGSDRFAIRPYPRELESRAAAADGRSYALRPIRPEDRDALVRLVEKSSAEDLRLRFFAHLVALPPALASRLTQIDYDREMAWAVTPENGPPEFLAVGRLACDPDRRRAEFALLVRSDCKRQGLGRILMTRMIAYARNIGIQEIFGTAIKGNEAVIALCRAFGFVVAPSDMDDTVRLSLETASNSD